MSIYEKSIIKVSHIEESTNLLGPYNRFVIWVHGCCFDCEGCLAENTKNGVYEEVEIDLLAKRVAKSPCEGITISGGEPFLQANALLNLIRKIKYQRDIGVVVYSGFTLDELKQDDDKKTLERLHSDKDTLQNEYAPLSLLDSIQGLLDDEATDAIQDVRAVGEVESQRIEAETDTAEGQKRQISGEIRSEISKLNAGLEKLRRSGNIEFGKRAVEQSSQEYKKQIDKFKALISELGESNGGSLDASGSADGVQAFFVNEGQDSNNEQGTLSDAPSFDNPFSSGLNSTMTKYPTISGTHSIEDDLIATNPNYSQTDPDSPWNNNCQRCVSAYEARRRGFDVEAQPIPSGMDSLPIMRHPNGWPSVYEGAELIDCSANSGTGAAINIENQMEEWGSDVRAIVRVRWKPENGGGGHVFIAERTNGTTRFIDPQNGETDARSYFDFAKGSEVFCMRIDNLPFSERIHQCCSSRTAA